MRKTICAAKKVAGGNGAEQKYANARRPASDLPALGEDQPVWEMHHGSISKGARSWPAIHPEHHLVVTLNIDACLEDFGHFMAIKQAISRAFLSKPIGPQ